MIVANPNPTDNPNSSNSAADKEDVLKARAARLSNVGRLVSNVWDAVAAHATFDQFERSAREILRQTGERMQTLFVKAKGNGDFGDSVTTDDGDTLRRSKTPRDTVVRSTFGVHAFRQFTYSAGKNKAIELRPVSARLALPAHNGPICCQSLCNPGQSSHGDGRLRVLGGTPLPLGRANRGGPVAR